MSRARGAAPSSRATNFEYPISNSDRLRVTCAVAHIGRSSHAKVRNHDQRRHQRCLG